ncbi:metallophosphoesterase [Pedobacter sp. SYSU D00535]|uniref:metallophosphoesterase family protein n=1 Tax=Pedobacter sp. SYSU D00535 TaxID=2810308 RepID=UPI001A95D439|nr:metallophosphoesterase family protein [Pedobacter sp. SYSU D00535]
MRIAIFSDIHANLPALEAFFEDIQKRDIDSWYCLGDLVGYNTWPNEVIEEIRKRKIPTIAGNHDLKVKKLKRDEGLEVDYAYHIGSDDARDYLSRLPRFIRKHFELDGAPATIMLVHGSPRSVNEYLLEDLEESYVSAMMEEEDADIMFCGHTHKPYHRTLTTSNSYRHLINVGSIGKPKDGDPRGCYVILTLDKSSSLKSADGIKVEFFRFEYDVEKAASAVENSPLPTEFADRLRKAY